MKVYDSASIRNVAIVGHSGAGKTQLAAAMLFTSGMANRLGKVDDGTTITDFDDEEIARKHTLSSSLAYAEWNKKKINLIDTPGIANFFSDARAALSICDGALVVVDAVAGVEVQTEKVWTSADNLGIPCLVVLNRMDRDRASLDRSLLSLRDVFGRTVVPVQIPIGEDKAFRGVVDLVSMQALTFLTDGSGTLTVGAVPADLAEGAHAARDALIELVAEADETLMERFFDAGTLTQAELEAGLRSASLTRRVFPLLCTSALLNVGVQPLLDALLAYAPSPLERSIKAIDRASGEPATYDESESAPAAAFVWKTIADPFAGRLTLFRVASGTLKSDTTIYNLIRETSERLGHLALLQGKTQTSLPEIKAGDLGVVAKLRETQTGDTLAG